MKLCKKIKIDVSRQDAQALEFMQGKCRGQYNWWIMKLRNGERWNLNDAKKSLQESKAYDPELRCVYGKLLAEVYFRIENGMQAFFRRVAEGEKKAGFPRVKPRHQFFTLCYPAMYLTVLANTIILPTGGGGDWGPKRYPNIVAHLTEDPPPDFREVAVTRDARGDYFCSFVHEEPEQISHPEGIVAFDLGIKTLATGYTNTGRFYRIGGFQGYRYYNKQLDKIRWSGRDQRRRPQRRGRSGASVTVWCIMIGDSIALCRCLPTSVCCLGKNSLRSANEIRPNSVMPVSSCRRCPCGSERIAVRTAAW